MSAEARLTKVLRRLGTWAHWHVPREDIYNNDLPSLVLVLYRQDLMGRVSDCMLPSRSPPTDPSSQASSSECLWQCY
jgi:hypothetical protein